MSTTEMCQEVEESLSDLLDGTANARLYDHVAECDACRDLKHEAALVADRVRDAGADFRPADDYTHTLIRRERRSLWPSGTIRRKTASSHRASPSHGENRGSSPLGSANHIKALARIPIGNWSVRTSCGKGVARATT